MSETVDIAVVDPTSLTGEAIVDRLAEGFPVGRLCPVGSPEDEGPVNFRGDELFLDALEGFDFSQVQLAIFACDRQTAETHVPRAAEAGCVVIDASTRYSGDEDVPLVAAAINPGAVSGYAHRRILASPSAMGLEAATVLAPFASDVGIERVGLVVLQAVSARGRQGVDTLARQTVDLLNARDVEPGLFGRQMAFNVLPSTGVMGEDGVSGDEAMLAAELRRLLGLASLPLSVTVVQVPVFFGDGMAVHFETSEKVDAARARELLAAMPGVDVAEGGATATLSPVSKGDTARARVGRIREEDPNSNGLSLWVVADGVRAGAAANSVQIAEILVQGYL